MLHHVIVSFGKESQFDFRVAGEGLPESARAWFDHEFKALGCQVDTPTGKVLSVDRVLSVAQYAGEARFRDDVQWSRRFVENTATLLGRELIRVDVGNRCIGY